MSSQFADSIFITHGVDQDPILPHPLRRFFAEPGSQWLVTSTSKIVPDEFSIDPEACEIHSFTVEENAIGFYDSIMRHRDPRVGCTLPIFTSEDQPGCYFVAIKKDGVALRTVLADRKELFYDQLGVFKVKVSQAYRKLIRDLVEVVASLRQANRRTLRCSFSLDSISLKVDPNVGQHLVVLVNRFHLLQADGDITQDWADLASFIRTINHETDIGDGQRLGTLSTTEVEQVLARLDDGNLGNIYDLSFFWGNDIRYNFICNLHAYFEDNSHIRLSDATITPVIGSNWQAKIIAYEVLRFLNNQDNNDKIKFKVRPLVRKPTQEDNNLAGCLDFMRQTLHHFSRMMSSLPENKRKVYGIHSKFDLMLLYEKVFPGHIALLAARIVVISPPGVLSQLAYGAF